MQHKNATAVQSQVLSATKEKTDLLAISPTGTGKTEAFVIPILAKLVTVPAENRTQVLIISPTRELTLQTANRIESLSKGLEITSLAIYGGQSYETSKTALAQKQDIIIATPGRLLDLIEKDWLDLLSVELLVIDEIDQLLDLGFLQSLYLLIGELPKDCSKWMFSATMNAETKKLADKILRKPKEIQVLSNDEKKLHERIFFVDKDDKKELLKHLILSKNLSQVIVFTRTTHAVDRIQKFLMQHGIPSASLYGEKKQSEREKALDDLIKKEIRVLIATDIATRGIDIQSLEAIFNYEVPETAETYIHRIGRTSRGLNDGYAFTFCDADENAKLIQLQGALKRTIPIEDSHPFVLNWQKSLSKPKKSSKKKRK
ncbi:DEAD/DEAH box helicase [Sphingobacterium hungaricum]|uniref:DEAD/DEAH box helicase n=1 Tax=Sphingobacterium hungaricum TaxID=2082723 RepID=UPI0018C8EAEF|nr:DEAD/DEAH box helicase [Sphingobacterium hungaricum]